MDKYIVWYKKEIKADNIKQVIIREKKVKAVFHSVVKEKPEKIEQGVSAIGFQYYG